MYTVPPSKRPSLHLRAGDLNSATGFENGELVHNWLDANLGRDFREVFIPPFEFLMHLIESRLLEECEQLGFTFEAMCDVGSPNMYRFSSINGSDATLDEPLPDYISDASVTITPDELMEEIEKWNRPPRRFVHEDIGSHVLFSAGDLLEEFLASRIGLEAGRSIYASGARVDAVSLDSDLGYLRVRTESDSVLYIDLAELRWIHEVSQTTLSSIDLPPSLY